MDNIFFEGFQYLVLQFLAFIGILNLTNIYFFQQFFLIWKCYSSGLYIVYVRSVNYTFILGRSHILDNIYILVFLVSSEYVMLLVSAIYLLYTLYSKLYFLYLLEDKNLCFVTKDCSKSSYTCAFTLPKKQHN